MPHEPVLSTWKQSAEELDFDWPDSWYQGEHFHRLATTRPVAAADILLSGFFPVHVNATLGDVEDKFQDNSEQGDQEDGALHFGTVPRIDRRPPNFA